MESVVHPTKFTKHDQKKWHLQSFHMRHPPFFHDNHSYFMIDCIGYIPFWDLTIEWTILLNEIPCMWIDLLLLWVSFKWECIKKRKNRFNIQIFDTEKSTCLSCTYLAKSPIWNSKFENLISTCLNKTRTRNSR